MSTLKIFHPDEPTAEAHSSEAAESSVSTSEPVILNFQEWASRLRGHSQTALQRAKSIRANCTCPQCHGAGVYPLVLNDGRRDGAGQEVPGSATLVGFHCELCDHEWPVEN